MMHEHLFRAGGPEVDHDKDFKLDDYDICKKFKNGMNAAVVVWY